MLGQVSTLAALAAQRALPCIGAWLVPAACKRTHESPTGHGQRFSIWSAANALTPADPVTAAYTPGTHHSLPTGGLERSGCACGTSRPDLHFVLHGIAALFSQIVPPALVGGIAFAGVARKESGVALILCFPERAVTDVVNFAARRENAEERR